MANCWRVAWCLKTELHHIQISCQRKWKTSNLISFLWYHNHKLHSLLLEIESKSGSEAIIAKNAKTMYHALFTSEQLIMSPKVERLPTISLITLGSSGIVVLWLARFCRRWCKRQRNLSKHVIWNHQNRLLEIVNIGKVNRLHWCCTTQELVLVCFPNIEEGHFLFDEKANFPCKTRWFLGYFYFSNSTSQILFLQFYTSTILTESCLTDLGDVFLLLLSILWLMEAAEDTATQPLTQNQESKTYESLFPVDISLEDCREAIRGRTEFVEKQQGNLIIFNYQWCTKRTFPDPNTAPDARTAHLLRVRRECR